jgi:hypothetical protein
MHLSHTGERNNPEGACLQEVFPVRQSRVSDAKSPDEYRTYQRRVHQSSTSSHELRLTPSTRLFPSLQYPIALKPKTSLELFLPLPFSQQLQQLFR